MINIQAQRKLSHSIATALSNVIQKNYHTAGEAIDIGSYGRGTNTDDHPDIDLLFTGILHDPQQGYVDWTPIDTFSLTSRRDGIQDLADIQQLDPILFKTIMESLQQLETLGYHPRFHGVKAWRDDPAVIFMLSIEHPQPGTIEIDITLHYANSHFSIEHVRRFDHYIQAIAMQYGEASVQQTLADIRCLKKQVKAESSHQGQLDRKKKLPGFVIESLFLYQSAPLPYDKVISLLNNHAWSKDEQMKLPEFIQEQKEQLIDANKTLDDLLRSVTRGGYETLKTVAARESKRKSL